jgi:hypothetical protein
VVISTSQYHDLKTGVVSSRQNVAQVASGANPSDAELSIFIHPRKPSYSICSGFAD